MVIIVNSHVGKWRFDANEHMQPRCVLGYKQERLENFAGAPMIGDRVRAKWHKNGKWYSARVHDVNGDGTFNIHHDDGDKESRVAPECVYKTDFYWKAMEVDEVPGYAQPQTEPVASD
jgi:hypothetical protein